jgi:hypothetical protein
MEDYARMAGAMNPALWAFNMMPPEAPKPAKKGAAPKPRAAAKKARR